MNFKMATALVLAGLAVIFIIQNVTVVNIQFLFWSIQMSRSLLMFFLLAAGIVIGWFMHGHFRQRR